MSQAKEAIPPSPPDRFFSCRRIWAHLQWYRESYLFPIVAVTILYFSIRLVNHLTGRAVVDDPGAIIGGLYNAILIIVAVAITGAVQSHQIPDVTNGDKLTWQMHAINCLCTLVFFSVTLFFIFK